MSSSQTQLRFVQHNERTVEYCILQKKTQTDSPNKRAVLVFYPMGSTAELVRIFEHVLNKTRSDNLSVIAVARPGTGKTDFEEKTLAKTLEAAATLAHKTDGIEFSNKSNHLRLRQHALDCMAVLANERVSEVFVMGLCLGHPFAMTFIDEHLRMQPHHRYFELQLPIILVAPWVSTACPHVLGIARFGGNSLGAESLLVQAGTWLGACVSSGGLHVATNWLPTSSVSGIVRKQMTKEENAAFTDDDVDALMQHTKQHSSKGSAVVHLDMRIGACPEWQIRAVEPAVQKLMHERLQRVSVEQKECKQEDADSGRAVVKVVSAMEDELTAPAASKWYVERLRELMQDAYVKWTAGTHKGVDTQLRMQTMLARDLVWEEKPNASHQGTVLGGGPKRKPLIFQNAFQDWGLFA